MPARATITTGNHPIKCNGVDGRRILEDQPKLAEVFARAGCDAVMSAANPFIHEAIKEAEQRSGRSDHLDLHTRLCQAGRPERVDQAGGSPDTWKLAAGLGILWAAMSGAAKA